VVTEMLLVRAQSGWWAIGRWSLHVMTRTASEIST